MAVVGRVARPHGLRGDVVVKPETDFVAERFRPGATLWTRSAGREEQLTIASARVQNGRPVVGFEGLSSIEAVERLAGLELRVPEESLQPLEPGRYYEHQLVGCSVETADGARSERSSGWTAALAEAGWWSRARVVKYWSRWPSTSASRSTSPAAGSGSNRPRDCSS